MDYQQMQATITRQRDALLGEAATEYDLATNSIHYDANKLLALASAVEAGQIAFDRQRLVYFNRAQQFDLDADGESILKRWIADGAVTQRLERAKDYYLVEWK